MIQVVLAFIVSLVKCYHDSNDEGNCRYAAHIMLADDVTSRSETKRAQGIERCEFMDPSEPKLDQLSYVLSVSTDLSHASDSVPIDSYDVKLSGFSLPIYAPVSTPDSEPVAQWRPDLIPGAAMALVGRHVLVYAHRDNLRAEIDASVLSECVKNDMRQCLAEDCAPCAQSMISIPIYSAWRPRSTSENVLGC